MADTAQFPPGAMLDEKYRIDQLLSVGGMGAVYVGMHTLLKKRVAIKVLRTELAGALNMVERFQREAVAASQIGHDNIVAVTDMGTTQGGVAFLVMELLVGRSLAQAIKDEAPMSVDRVTDIARGILAGLGAAHNVGIVHRDMKPENLFLAARPGGREVVKILDFGISSIAAAQNPEPRLTITGIVMGTPNYMAPEQARGDRDIDGGADVYSLGVILYEMLTGQIPYEAENYNLLMHRVLSGEYVKLRMRRPDVSEELEAVIHKAMALHPRDRYLSAGALAMALAPFSKDAGFGAPAAAEGVLRSSEAREARVAVSPGTNPTADLSTAQTMMAASASLPIAGEPMKRSRTPLYVAIGAALLGVAALSVVLGRGGGNGGSAPTEASMAVQPAPPAQQQPPPPQQPPPQDPPKAAEVVIDFAVTPADARITVDGKALASPRWQAAASTTPIDVRIEAEGFEPYVDRIVPERSMRMPVRLVKARVVKAGSGKGSGKTRPPAGTPKPPVEDPPKKPEKIIKDSPYGP